MLLFSVNVFAQNKAIDSLKQALSVAKEDTNKVWLFVDLGNFYQWSYPDSAITYSQQGLQLSQKLNFTTGEIIISGIMAEALAVKGNFSKALDIRLKALQLAEKSGDQYLIYWRQLGVGTVYFYSGDQQNALNYYYKGKANKEVRPEDIETISGFIGESYFALHHLDSALLYIQKAYDLDIKKKSHWSVPYYYLAAIYLEKGQNKESLDYYREGIRVSVANKDIVDGYNGIAAAFKKSGQTDSSVYYAKKAFVGGQHASLIPGVIEASSLLTDIYSAKHNQDSAFKYQGIMLAMKDSLFSREKVKQMENLSFNEQIRQQEIVTEREQFQNKIKMYALLAVIVVFLVIAFILWRNNKHKQKAYALLQKQKQEIDIQRSKAEKTLEELRTTQAQLIQSEKMASLGELTAGIAHEIQNPLNFVNNFSEVNTELIDEMQQEMDNGNLADAKAISNDIKENEQKINHHGKRAGDIVKGMLQHSRSSTSVKEPTDINKLADEYLRLAYHGLRAKDKSFNATMKTDFDETIGNINIIPQDIGRVILNLITNAFYAAPLPPEGGFKKDLTVTTGSYFSPSNFFFSVVA